MHFIFRLSECMWWYRCSGGHYRRCYVAVVVAIGNATAEPTDCTLFVSFFVLWNDLGCSVNCATGNIRSGCHGFCSCSPKFGCHVTWVQAIEKKIPPKIFQLYNSRSVIVKILNFALWTNVTIILFHVRLGCYECGLETFFICAYGSISVFCCVFSFREKCYSCMLHAPPPFCVFSSSVFLPFSQVLFARQLVMTHI